MGAPKYGRGHEFKNWSQTVFVFKCPEKQNSDVRLDVTSKANEKSFGPVLCGHCNGGTSDVIFSESRDRSSELVNVRRVTVVLKALGTESNDAVVGQVMAAYKASRSQSGTALPFLRMDYSAFIFEPSHDTTDFAHFNIQLATEASEAIQRSPTLTQIGLQCQLLYITVMLVPP